MTETAKEVDSTAIQVTEESHVSKIQDWPTYVQNADGIYLSIDQIRLTGGGDYIISGWIYDELNELQDLTVSIANYEKSLLPWVTSTIRPDVQGHLAANFKLTAPMECGFISILAADEQLPLDKLVVSLMTKSGNRYVLKPSNTVSFTNFEDEVSDIVRLCALDVTAIGKSRLVDVIESTFAARLLGDTTTLNYDQNFTRAIDCGMSIKALADAVNGRKFFQDLASSPLQLDIADMEKGFDLFAKLVGRQQGLKASRNTNFQWREGAVSIDRAIIAGPTSIVVIGWVINPSAIDRLTLITQDNRHLPLTPFSMAMPRPDVKIGMKNLYGNNIPERCGFVAIVQVDEANESDLTLWLRCKNGEVSLLQPSQAEQATTAELTVEKLITLAAEAGKPEIFNVLGPVISDAWAGRVSVQTPPEMYAYGDPPQNPLVSIIVPLFGRADFMRHQLLHFSRDEDFRKAELIYILDDPLLVDTISAEASLWFRLYKVPFKLMINKKNLGYAGANNAAAKYGASANVLLLLNSDVMPTKTGWLSQMLKIYSQIQQPSVLTPRLLFPDGSIQYAGMDFELNEWLCPFYLNTHPGKGMPVNADPAKGLTKVKAGTGACLMISASLYWDTGGLDDAFIHGDFEDSDLCLKLTRDGGSVYYTPDIELFHLERQSIPSLGQSNYRQAVTFYNSWLHHSRWNMIIKKMVEQPYD
jgi:GT2 family glycosyltransferase